MSDDAVMAALRTLANSDPRVPYDRPDGYGVTCRCGYCGWSDYRKSGVVGHERWCLWMQASTYLANLAEPKR